MVAGMAMAIGTAPSQSGGRAVNVSGNKGPLWITDAAHVHQEGPANVDRVTRSFTPILTAGLAMWTSTYGVIVWGRSPL